MVQILLAPTEITIYPRCRMQCSTRAPNFILLPIIDNIRVEPQIYLHSEQSMYIVAYVVRTEELT